MSHHTLPLPVTASRRSKPRRTRQDWPCKQPTGQGLESRPVPCSEDGTDDKRSDEKSSASSDAVPSYLDKSFSCDADGRWTRCGWPSLPEPVDRARKLSRAELAVQRAIFISFVVVINLGLAAMTIFAHVGIATLVLVLIFKLQDCLSSIVTIVCLAWTSVANLSRKSTPVPGQWVLTLLPAYNESEEQMLRAIEGLRDNIDAPHKQLIVIVLDGRPKTMRADFSHIVADFTRPYHSLKCRSGILHITAGFLQNVPIILIEKLQNSGKKDTLVLTHDLFNYPRDDMPEYTRLLRREIWETVLPELTKGTDFRSFDMIFCTDADSIIHKGCMTKLMKRLARDEKAIAACGLVLVEFEPGYRYSFWNFFQLLQYAYGQHVRRWAEGFIGKVTCLPGCVTMIAVRPEMAGAIADFARPGQGDWVLHHQVQNLGTDRRLTYCMLSQSKELRTVFVPDAVSETVAPQSFKHYLDQRRRWGSNAYFNNFFYCGGRNMIPWTRLLAFLHIVRQTCVYFRILNTILFIRALVMHFHFLKILPLLVIGQFPAIWFCICLVSLRPLRVRIHQILVGFFVNKLVSPVMSSIVFAAVAINLGKAGWGMSGITASSNPAVSRRQSIKSSDREQTPPRKSAAGGVE
ncbi:hypothetical protein XA68_15216 [Ophiocordyceps unilateralis]|uniref:chitin synthase n=1 Tax=Ophiocordyceps unilateralis TaxID=268505 RepID=A0A2A9P8Z6_OPHUN|nr:hypothetical protein XA68_15216 [Ophiocordyceps unilateralis]